MFSLVKFLFKLPPLSLIPFALHHKRKLPGLLWVGGLGFLAWKKFGPQITARIQEATSAYPAPAEGTWSGPTGGPEHATPTMAVASDLTPANAAPVTTPEPQAETVPATGIDPVAEAEAGVTGLTVGDDEVAPDPAPVTTTG